MSWKRFINQGAMLLGLLVILTSCVLDRSFTPAPERFEVSPGLVCAGETVHLSWQITNPEPCAVSSRPSPGLPRCSSVSSVVSSDPAISIGSTSNPGTADVAVTQDTTFSATFVQCEARGDFDICTLPYTVDQSVEVIDGAGTHQITFAGTCRGWAGVSLSELSACLQMDQICAPSLRRGDGITVWALDASGAPIGTPVRLTSDQPCYTAENLRGAASLSAARSRLAPSPPLNCADVSPGNVLPSIVVNINLSCNATAPGCALGAGGGIPPGGGGGGSSREPDVCGNGLCEPGETANSCPTDCSAVPAAGACFDVCDPDDPAGCLAGLLCLPRVAGGDEHICYNDVICNPDVTQEPNVTQGPGEQACVCGDGVCEQSRCSEFQQNCPADCGVSQPPPPAPVCGDGACNGGETCWSCAADCGPC